MDNHEDIISINSHEPYLTPSEETVFHERKTAVAIGTDANNLYRQKITAAGKGELAEQILQLAFAHGIKVRTDRELALLLGKLEMDSPIPTEALLAVAEILSYVYQANREPNPFDFALKLEHAEDLLQKLSQIKED